MPLTNTQYASIMRLYDDIKTANRSMQSDRYNEVTALCPDIANIDSEIIDLSVKTARARIEADSSDTNTDELTSSLKSLNERKVAALASIGKPADYLDDIFTCPYCKDSGYVNGKRCICFNKKAIDLIYNSNDKESLLRSGSHTEQHPCPRQNSTLPAPPFPKTLHLPESARIAPVARIVPVLSAYFHSPVKTVSGCMHSSTVFSHLSAPEYAF